MKNISLTLILETITLAVAAYRKIKEFFRGNSEQEETTINNSSDCPDSGSNPPKQGDLNNETSPDEKDSIEKAIHQHSENSTL